MNKRTHCYTPTKMRVTGRHKRTGESFSAISTSYKTAVNAIYEAFAVSYNVSIESLVDEITFISFTEPDRYEGCQRC